MRNKAKIQTICLALAGMIAFCGCGVASETNAPVEGLYKLGAVDVLAREEGSGTRSAFAQLIGIDKSITNGKIDLTRDDAVIIEATAEMIERVEQDASAIGYISLGALNGTENIKVLSVDGVSPEESSRYPLSRPFCLAYCGQISELELDFLTYVRGAGQEIVSESYTPIAKSSTFLSNKESGEILIDGSTSAAPLVEQLAEAYMEINPNAVITVTSSDSSAGLTNAMSGKCDLGMSSRSLKDYELELLDYVTIAEDAIAVIVNAENPLENITAAQLEAIYTGEIADWEEINNYGGK